MHVQYNAEDVDFYPASRGDTTPLLKRDAQMYNTPPLLPMVQTSSDDYTDVLIVGAGESYMYLFERIP